MAADDLLDRAARPREDRACHLRLYVARFTPNSVRAEQNLSIALDALGGGFSSAMVEVIDVLSQPRRAITDGVIVTPTLIGTNPDRRIVLMGDLADQARLRHALQNLLA